MKDAGSLAGELRGRKRNVRFKEIERLQLRLGFEERRSKNLQYFLVLDYPIQIDRMEDGMYCASIPLLKGCTGYGDSPTSAIEELNGVKESLLKLMMEQGKPIPEPTVKLEIPVSDYSRLRNRRLLKRFVKSDV